MELLPSERAAPFWVGSFVEVVQGAEAKISTIERKTGLDSDGVLSEVGPGLLALGYVVERGKRERPRFAALSCSATTAMQQSTMRSTRSTMNWGSQSRSRLVVGRLGTRTTRTSSIVRTSLILDARNMALLMPVRYRTTAGQREHVMPAYEKTRNQLDAIYASQRLKLPF